MPVRARRTTHAEAHSASNSQTPRPVEVLDAMREMFRITPRDIIECDAKLSANPCLVVPVDTTSPSTLGNTLGPRSTTLEVDRLTSASITHALSAAGAQAFSATDTLYPPRRVYSLRPSCPRRCPHTDHTARPRVNDNSALLRP